MATGAYAPHGKCGMKPGLTSEGHAVGEICEGQQSEHQTFQVDADSSYKGEDCDETCAETGGNVVVAELHGSPTTLRNSEGPKTDTNQVTTSIDVDSHITFVDPIGTKWTFPFQQCKTWGSMRTLIKRVFVDCYLPKRYLKFLDNQQATHRRFKLMLLAPQESCILPDHWEARVQPGWEVTIEFRNSADILDEIAESKAIDTASSSNGSDAVEIESETPPMLNSKSAAPSTGEPETTDPPNPKSDILYRVEYLNLDRFREYKVTSTKSASEPIAVAMPNESQKDQSILEELLKVYRKRKKSKSDEFLPRPWSDDSEDSDGEVEVADKVGKPTLYVRSQILLGTLRATVECQSEQDEEHIPGKYSESRTTKLCTDINNGIFVYPFTDLFHNLDRMKNFLSAESPMRAKHPEDYNQQCDNHINVLLNYLYSEPSIQLAKAEALWNQDIPRTTFSWFWLLLQPGIDVYVKENDQLNGYVIESFRGGNLHSRSRYPKPYSIDVWSLEFDGEKLNRAVKTIDVPVFDGEREIQALPLFPTRFHRSSGGELSLRDALVARGKTYIDVVKAPAFREYSGPSYLYGVRMYNRTRVIVDHTSKPWNLYQGDDVDCPIIGENDSSRDLGARIRIPECPCGDCATARSKSSRHQRRMFDDYDAISLTGHSAPESLTEHQYFLCSSHVYAFILKDRFWDFIDVRDISAPTINKDVIKTLVMKPESNKDMIKAICETFSGSEPNKAFFADFIQGKGEGQIMLLHGPPGTGKTLTAESVAEFTGRPLLSITAADLGHEPDQLEKRLLKFFRDANKWDAVVLLDEADVYLQTRSPQDLIRNGVVSVFLRALDYFQGILFLTTNRVGTFDEAFMSRIHIQIGYDPLDDESRKKIWTNHFNKLERNYEMGGREIRYSLMAKEFVSESNLLKELKWNGREIRNAFQTAVALASYEAKEQNQAIPRVTDAHIRQVVEMSRNFKHYMKSTLMGDASQLAAQQFIRNDKVVLNPPPLR